MFIGQHQNTPFDILQKLATDPVPYVKKFATDTLSAIANSSAQVSSADNDDLDVPHILIEVDFNIDSQLNSNDIFDKVLISNNGTGYALAARDWTVTQSNSGTVVAVGTGLGSVGAWRGNGDEVPWGEDDCFFDASAGEISGSSQISV